MAGVKDGGRGSVKDWGGGGVTSCVKVKTVHGHYVSFGRTQISFFYFSAQM